MSVIKKKSIQALLAGIDDHEQANKRIKGSNFKTLKTLYEEFLKTDSKAQRDKMINEFKKRNEEFAEFLNSNTELIDNELQKSLLIAASGGEYDEEEIILDSKGNKRIKRTKKTALPDVAAVRELRLMMGGNENTESTLAQAWLDAILGGDENEQEE